MSVVLAILKVIGIVLGVILGLLLLLVAAVLFVPVRYYAESKKDETPFGYGFTVSWLCHLVTIRKKMNSDNIQIRVLGIPFGRRKRSGKRKETGNKPRNKPKDESGNRPENKIENKTEKKSKDDKSEDKPERVSSVKQRKKEKHKKKTSKKHFSFASVSSIMKEIRDKGNRKACKILWGEFWQLLCYLSPKKVKLEMVIGTGDPCNTGLLFGGISMIPWIYSEGVHVMPDFEEKTFFLDGYVKGRMRVLYFIRLVLRLYRNQDLKRFYYHITKKEAA